MGKLSDQKFVEEMRREWEEKYRTYYPRFSDFIATKVDGYVSLFEKIRTLHRNYKTLNVTEKNFLAPIFETCRELKSYGATADHEVVQKIPKVAVGRIHDIFKRIQP